jgi:hypothetical protein
MDKIIYLAQKLQAFTFDEILILAEIEKGELENILEKLVIANVLSKTSQGYVFVTVPMLREIQKKKVLSNKSYGIFVPKKVKNKNMNFYTVVEHFFNNYVLKFCTRSTIKTYNSMFRNHILPYFNDKKFEKIKINDVMGFFIYCQDKNLSEKRIKNVMALLRQILHYAKDKGFSEKVCDFQVRRLSEKNKFDISRIIFAEGAQQCF